MKAKKACSAPFCDSCEKIAVLRKMRREIENMKNYVMNRKSVYAGTQEEIARTICLFLWGDASKQAVRCVVDFIRVQRTLGARELVWRGVGIDTTARACKCWVEDRHAVNAFRESIGVLPL